MKSLFLILIIPFIISAYEVKFHPFINEITQENKAELINELRTSEYKDLHKYLLKLVLHPEDADLNKDRKISPFELRKSLEWLIFPKSNEKYLQLDSDLIDKTSAAIELFVINIKYFLSYKQYQELLSRIRAENFIDFERMKKSVEAKRGGFELADDL